jgi:hypothetical protein
MCERCIIKVSAGHDINSIFCNVVIYSAAAAAAAAASAACPDGPPLSMGEQLRGPGQPQAVHVVSAVSVSSECLRANSYHRQVLVLLHAKKVLGI